MTSSISKLKQGESSHDQPNSKHCRTLPPYLCSGCGRPHVILILNEDEDSGPKFGPVPPRKLGLAKYESDSGFGVARDQTG